MSYVDERCRQAHGSEHGVYAHIAGCQCNPKEYRDVATEKARAAGLVRDSVLSPQHREAEEVAEDVVALNPLDQFDRALIEMKRIHDRKRNDYSKEGDRFSNFREAAAFSDVEPWQAFEVLIGTKQARLNELRKGLKIILNESIADSLLDRAVYCVLAYAYYRSLDRAKEDPNAYKRYENGTKR